MAMNTGDPWSNPEYVRRMAVHGVKPPSAAVAVDPSSSEGAFSNFVDQIQSKFMSSVKGGLEGVHVLGTALGNAIGVDANEGMIAQDVMPWLRGRIEAPENRPAPGMENSFGTNLGGAIGSAAAFIPGSVAAIAAAPAGASATAIAGISALMAGTQGALMEAGPAYYETLAKTGDEGDAWRAYFGHGAFGATEGLFGVVPGIGKVARILAKIDKVWGGAAAKKVIVELLKGGAVEAAQEGFQNVGGAMFDKYFLEHPTEARDFLDVVKSEAWQSMLPAFVLGAGFNSIEQAATRAVGQDPQAAIEGVPTDQVGMQEPTPVANTKADQYYAKTVDYLHRLKKDIEAKVSSAKKPVTADVASRFMQFKGRVKKTIGQVLDPIRKRFVDTLKAHRISVDEFDAYVKATGARLRNALIAEKRTDPDTGLPFEGGSGMSDAEANAILSKVRSDKRYRGFVEARKIYDEAVLKNRAMLRASGDLSAEKLAAIEADYTPEAAAARGIENREGFKTFYVPYRTAQMEGEGFGSGGAGMTASGSQVKGALGRSSESGSPLTFVLQDLQNTIVRAEKLRVMREVAKLADELGDKSFAHTVSMPTKLTENEQGEVVETSDLNWQRSRDDAVPYKTEDGTTRAIIFGRKYAHHAATLRGETLSSPAPLVGKITAWMAKWMTRKNPAFFIPNGIRDLGHAVTLAYSRHGAGAAGAILKDVMSGRAWNEVRQHVMHGKTSPLFKEFMDNGGEIGTLGYESYADRWDKLSKDVSRAVADNKIGEAVMRAVKWIENENDVVEMMTRLASYRWARESGKSINEAIRISKEELGINFERKGEWGPAINSLYAFSNAGIQGTDALVRGLKTKNGVKVLGATIALGAMNDALQRLVSPTDDDGEKEYDKIPEYTKDRNLIFMNPLGGSYVSIPLPLGWNWLVSAGRHMSSVGMGAEDVAPAAISMWMGGIDVFDPFGGGPFEQQIAPTAMDPLIQLATNKSFTGKAIAPENLPFGVQKPDSQMFYSGVSDIPRWAAEFMSDTTELDDSGKGFIEVSPNTIEHALSSVFAGFGKTIVQGVSSAGSLAKGELPEARDIPILSRLYGEVSPYATDRKYRDAVTHIQEVKARYDELRRSGEGARALEWRKENLRLFQAIGRMQATERVLGRIDNKPENEERRREYKSRFLSFLKGRSNAA